MANQTNCHKVKELGANTAKLNEEALGCNRQQPRSSPSAQKPSQHSKQNKAKQMQKSKPEGYIASTPRNKTHQVKLTLTCVIPIEVIQNVRAGEAKQSARQHFRFIGFGQRSEQ